MDIRSEVGRGTTVTLYLPRGKTAAEKPGDADEVGSGRTRPLRILLVEDNREVAEVAKLLLSEGGHAITHADTADKAVAVLSRGSG